ncbi:glucokinase [Steroidobacter denitrificans]|uniref:Glucokinase n=1 Tax=Steroidobacter denitrificans TaxID=465721 RepID=A0A127F5F8_STEDE|nr:glucokinase [Steroidobacter denitrificans]AMN45686.1 glucokinase [Steroidobacter denitrificans]
MLSQNPGSFAQIPVPIRLIADVGGTNARFALLEETGWHAERVLACADFPDFGAAVEHYLAIAGAETGARRPLEAAIAIASPVSGDQVRMTNHVWQFSASQIRRRLGWRRFIILNDFTALAMAIRHLPSDELEQVGTGCAVPDRPLALLGPGTGLGMSGLIPAGEHWMPLQAEGGHATLPVVSEREIAVYRQLHQHFSHVSAERMLSGPGLVNIYKALCALDGVAAQLLNPPDITRRAAEASCRQCLEAVSLFCALLGTVAGNLALTLGATGGVYIGGGIVPALGRGFANSPFRDRFENKGRYRAYLAAVPTYVILTRLPALAGLARSFTAPGPRWEAD